MKLRTRVVGLGLAVAASVASLAPALADTSHTSTIAQLMVIEPGDKNYKSFHGAVWLEQDKASTNYRWGGAHCGGRDISGNTIQLLFAALRSGDQVSIEYVLSDIKGKPYRCLTAVTFTKG